MNPDLDLGRQLVHANRFDLAEPRIRRALAVEPHDASAHALLSRCLVARKAIGPALDEARESIRLDPSSCVGYAALGSIQEKRLRWRAAEAAYRDTIRFDPSDPNHRAALSFVLVNRHRPQAALVVAEQGLAIEPTHVGCLNSRAVALVSLGRIEESRASIHSALASSPLEAVLHSNLAMVLLQAGLAEEAEAESLEALRLDPTLAVAQQNLRVSKRAVGRPLFAPIIRRNAWWRRQPLWGRGAFVGGIVVIAVLTNTTPLLAILSIPVILGWLWRRAPEPIRASRPYAAATPIVRLSPFIVLVVLWMVLFWSTLAGLFPPNRVPPTGDSLNDDQIQSCLLDQDGADVAAAAGGIDLLTARSILIDANPPPSDLADTPIGPNAVAWLDSMTTKARGQPLFMSACAAASYPNASTQPS